MDLPKEKAKRSLKHSQQDRDRYISLIENILDNFLAIFFEPVEYFQSFKQYIAIQIKTRTKFFFIGIFFLFLSVYLLFFLITFFYLFLYEILTLNLRDKWVIYFILIWISFLIFFVATYTSLNFFFKIGRKLPNLRGNPK